MGIRVNRLNNFYGVLASVCLSMCAAASVAQESCQPNTVKIRGDWGSAVFQVEVADDPEERARGLMFVEHMPMMSGMIFVYDKPQSVAFWMRNTLIPLDMLFVGPDGIVQHIHENAIPHDETPIPGGQNVLAVLELNAGMVSRLGISVGDAFQHPVFGPEATFPC